MTTNDFARLMGVTAHTVRMTLYRTGSYFGLEPRRYPNGRLHWSEAEVHRMLAAAGIEQPQDDGA